MGAWICGWGAICGWFWYPAGEGSGRRRSRLKRGRDFSLIYLLEIVSMLLGMVIYMFIAMFSGMVMSSVIEEKASRVVEVLISSVKATELMFGKIIGVACVALTQFLLWVVLTLAIITVAGSVLGFDQIAQSQSGMMPGRK